MGEKIFKEPSPEEIELEIQSLLDNLHNRYGGEDCVERLGSGVMAEWYDIEMEAEVGIDRAGALSKLKVFVEKLKNT